MAGPAKPGRLLGDRLAGAVERGEEPGLEDAAGRGRRFLAGGLG